jgi:hypothetical protein
MSVITVPFDYSEITHPNVAQSASRIPMTTEDRFIPAGSYTVWFPL